MADDEQGGAAPARSLFDSRTLPDTATGDADADIETPRYLTHSSTDGGALSFNEAFAAIRTTASYSAPPLAAPPPLAPVPPSSKDAAALVLVNRCQTGNPLLKAVRNVSLEFRDGLVPDYVLEGAGCVLFLSVRYHLLHNGYLEDRIQRIRKEDPTPYRSKIVICFVDVDDNEVALREINRVALLSQFTLILAWSWLEAARYL
jgi:DNA excision repair protein ERCC-1